MAMFGRFRRGGDVVGFALSGGGARGASQVGALKALTEAGIAPAQLAGTSAGAVNAGWFALYPDRLGTLEKIWLELRQQDVFPGRQVQLLYNFTRKGYLHSAHRWEAFLRQHVADARFEDCAIPCAVIAVRLSDGERVVFDSGEIVPAVMASTAIPGVFPPYQIGDGLYVDGGVLEYLPVPTLIERGATTVYALDCSWFRDVKISVNNVVDRASRISAAASAAQVCSLPMARGRTVHLLSPELPDIGDARNFARTSDLVTIGYDHARRYLIEHRLGGLEGATDGTARTV